MNRLGDLAMGLIVVVALALSLAALYSFVSYSNNSQGASIALYELGYDVVHSTKYVERSASIIGREVVLCEQRGASGKLCEIKDLKERFMTVADLRDYNTGRAGNFFGKIRNGEFEFVCNSDSLCLLKVEDVSIRAVRDMHSFERTLDLCLQFDSQGKVVGRSCKDL